MIGFFCLITSPFSFASDCQQCQPNPYSSCETRNNCSCTDPFACGGSYDCLSRGACCEAFGNVGGFPDP